MGCMLLTCSIFCPTAIMQSIAQKNKWPLDRMTLSVDVTKKGKDEYGHPPREGAYIHGLYIEGDFFFYSHMRVLNTPSGFMRLYIVLYCKCESSVVFRTFSCFLFLKGIYEICIVYKNIFNVCYTE